MSDRVSASISIGGVLPASLRDELIALIQLEGLSTDWDGASFTADQIEPDKPLDLMAYDVPWGIFNALEQFCVQHCLAYQRNSGACPGSFGAERIVFDGKHGPVGYDTNDDNVVMISRETITHLGSMEAIAAYFASADITVPPLEFPDCALPKSAA